jgi:hypothetical protein
VQRVGVTIIDTIILIKYTNDAYIYLILGVLEAQKESRPDEVPNSVVVISSIHTVALLFKASIGTLAVPLVSHACYTAMIETTRRFEVRGGTWGT